MSSKPKKKIGQEFACKVKYLNPLPDLPFDPKLIEYPFQKDRDYRYESQSLYDGAPTPLYTSVTNTNVVNFLQMGTIEKILKDQQRKQFDNPNPDKLDEKDKALLVDPSTIAQSAGGKKSSSTSLFTKPIVPWLRRTEYISSEATKATTTTSESNLRNTLTTSDSKVMDRSREGQIQAIQNTFDLVQDDNKILNSLRHPTNKDLKPVELFQFFPDFETWTRDYTHAQFDVNPLMRGGKKQQQQQKEEEEEENVADGGGENGDVKARQALFKHNQINPKRVSYYTPTDESVQNILRKRKHNEVYTNETNEYKFERDFEHETKVDDDKKTLFLVVRPQEAAFYHLLKGKMNMKRIRKSKSTSVRTQEMERERPASISLSRRLITNDERHDSQHKLRLIAPLEADEDDDDDDDDLDDILEMNINSSQKDTTNNNLGSESSSNSSR